MLRYNPSLWAHANSLDAINSTLSAQNMNQLETFVEHENTGPTSPELMKMSPN
jgi:hypothetical protein